MRRPGGAVRTATWLTTPAGRHSFDGCEVCSKDTRNGCAFCFDDMCYSTLLKDTPNGHACSYPAPSGDASRCVPAVQVEMHWFDWGYVAAAGLCLSVVLSVLALLVLAPSPCVRGACTTYTMRVPPVVRPIADAAAVDARWCRLFWCSRGRTGASAPTCLASH
ncbi:hypothetical protein TcBrA4_0050640 [Trypanosoma cruzi]|nr:hypothetical protein TcBrA4_0050640 [Trypanosoma cruzi]